MAIHLFLGGLALQILDRLNYLAFHFRWADVLDILLVWLVAYRVLLLVRRSGTVQMLSGLGLLAIGYLMSIYFEFFTFNWLLEKFFSHLFLIVVIIFQTEIRRALAHIGSNPIFMGVSSVQETHLVEELVQGIARLAEKGYGALIVIEREISIDYHTESGTELDAIISADLLQAVFHPASPVHDGALIVRGAKIAAVGCFLPLSKNPALDKNLGTRHRAALGLTEETDALVFVVSEESKSIGFVSGGILHANIEVNEVRRQLFEAFGLKYKTAVG